ncbi:SAF domain-containing protein [Candidatus Protofrankia californiensis]|uniref:SAF domain-containing protein n=1 Tax=Candidatus Protofrankia californiensis TaxID=1839754 RepID=UPI001041B073|nr:SAF domain-containing protein [Candidatus Protofrankia californiensis]
MMSLVGHRAARFGYARAWRIAVGARRRVLAAVLAATAVVFAVVAVRPARPPSPASVVVAAVDLAGGVTMAPGDVRMVSLPVNVVPAGAARSPQDAVGRTLAAPVRQGEPITDARILGPGLITQRQAAAGLVATPVRITDAGSVLFLRVGDHVNVLAASTDINGTSAPQPREGTTSTDRAESSGDTSGMSMAGVPRARVVAPDVVVLAVARAGETAERAVSTEEGALVIVAATAGVATALAGAAVHARLSVTVLGGTSTSDTS